LFSHLTYLVVLHYLAKQETQKLRFSLKHCMLLCQRTHKTHLNYHLVAVELPFIPKVIDYMHQTIKTYLERELSILLSVPRTLHVYQVCHGVGRCVKDESCSSLSPEWKLMYCINGISYYLNKCQTLSTTSQMTFFSFSKTAHWCTCIVHATQSAAALSTFFLLNHASNTPYSWTHWLQDLGSHTAAWVSVVSQKSLKKSRSD